MSVINYRAKRDILIVVKGHPYQRDDFFALFETLNDTRYTAVEQPAAMDLIGPQCCDRYQALVFFDMPGLDFSVEPPALIEPDQQYQQRFIAMLEQGMGCVFLHHAIAAWPTWDEYADIIGGRFLYRPAVVRGEQCLDSGYRHTVRQGITTVGDHPVLTGVSSSFELVDEPYLFEVFDDDLVPLLRSDYTFERRYFNSAYRAVTGEPDSNRDWAHAAGSNVLGWVKAYNGSPIVYLQPGDSAETYRHPDYRRLVANAIDWVASDEAMQWADKRRR